MSESLKFSVILSVLDNQFQSAIKAAKQQLNTLGAVDTSSANAALKSLEGSINQVGQAEREVQKAALATARSITESSAQSQKSVAQVREEAARLSGAMSATTGSVKGFTASLLAVAGVQAGIGAVTAGLREMVAVTQQLQGVRNKLDAVFGASASAEFEFLKVTAKSLGQELLGTADSYASLAAATKGTRLEGEPTRQVFLGVSQAAATLGLSADNTKGVLQAVSQIASKGVVGMEELRGQLGDRLPGALNIAASSMGLTVQGLNKLVDSGSLSSDVFLNKFGPALVSAFSGTAGKAAQTLTGQMNDLRNQTTLFIDELGKAGGTNIASGFFGALGAAVSALRTGFQELQKDATLGALATSINQSFVNIWEALAGAIGAVVLSIRSIGEALGLLPAGLNNASTEVSFLTRTAQGLSIVFGGVSDVIGGLGLALQSLAFTFTATVSGILSAASAITPDALGGAAFRQAGDKLAETASQMLARINSGIANFQSSAKSALDSAAGNIEKVGVAATKTGAETVAGMSTAAAGVTNTGASISTVSAASSDAIGKIGDAAKSAGAAADLAEKNISASFNSLANVAGVQLPLAAESAQQLGAALADLAIKNDAAAEKIAASLPKAIEKLSAVDLAAFEKSFVGSFEKAGASAEYVAARVLDFAKASAALAKIDVSGSLGGLSDGFKKVSQSIDFTKENLQNLQTAGVDTGRLLLDSLAAALRESKNTKDLEALKKLYEDLGKSGKISGKQMEEGLVAVDAKARALKDALDPVVAAFKRLGIETKEALAVAAKNAERDFLTIEKSGQASAKGLLDAFKKYADAAVAANGGVVSEHLKAQAAASGYEITVDKAGNVAVKRLKDVAEAAREAADATKKAGDAADAAAGSYSRIPGGIKAPARQKTREDEAADAAKNGGGSNGVVPNSGAREVSGGASFSAGTDIGTRLGIVNFLKSAGLTDAQARDLSAEFIDQKGDVPFIGNPGQTKYGGDTLSVALLKAAEKVLFGGGSGGRGGSSVGGTAQPKLATATPPTTPKTNAAPSSPSNTQTAQTQGVYTIEFKDASGATQSVNAPNSNVAAEIVAMLQRAGANAVTSR